ncbi:hypothetical protein THASP1DRAFT_14422 [Thamnocephalis sphaerospora]|uniref:Glutamate--tRNA ligase, mitochondrial n=1 Tax=Thamnocephalis sphaerospora TaxID=78915 RepID=A0A4P9XT57_9FUNG|nr:hypothetical protein THASP1DRAFT_14422 [Thamnocephalis sphaerospora]|eukprot:RKP09316.1 hypothetical protein THASP1DRAFT_14422 [Thamnocephalis sphaerospora]
MLSPVRVRFAPSPTGFLHLGGLRTALFNYLLARKTGGKFVLRIEDTDQTRLVPGAVDNLVSALAWAGVRPDEGPSQGGDYGPYVQASSEAADVLLKGEAYHCFCTPEQLAQQRLEASRTGRPTAYDRRCTRLAEREVAERLRQGVSSVIRFRVPAGRTQVEDVLHGSLSFDNATQEDPVLLKSDGMPTYHLASVVDDHAMRISHVLRGEEWLPSTPKHAMLYRSLGWQPPQFVHLPLLYNTDRTKLSKRFQHANVSYYQESGYLPEAVVNFVALMGWSPKTTEEVFSMQQLVDQFSLEGLNKAGAVVSHEKLDWLNKQHLMQKCSHEGDIAPVVAQLRQALRTSGLPST